MSQNALGAQIRLDDVGHTFTNAGRVAHVVRSVSLTIEPGETLAIIGPSGAGKSTLLNMMMGRIAPSEGALTISVAHGRNPRLAAVFQEATLLPWLTAQENVRLPLELENRLDDADAKAIAALTRVGLAEFAAYRPSQLSGGMRSRVALARSLVNEPDILLLDEPFGDLDEVTSEDLMVDMANLIAETGVTTVIVTHSITQAAFLANHILVLRARAGGVAHQTRLDPSRPRSLKEIYEPAFQASLKDLRDHLREASHG